MPRVLAAAWSAAGLDVQTHGIAGPPAMITPEIASFETQDGLSDQTYLVSTLNGKLLKTLPESYTCMYDQISVVACYSSGVYTVTLVGLDATSLKRWAQVVHGCPSAAPPFVSKTKLASGRPIDGTPHAHSPGSHH